MANANYRLLSVSEATRVTRRHRLIEFGSSSIEVSSIIQLHVSGASQIRESDSFQLFTCFASLRVDLVSGHHRRQSEPSLCRKERKEAQRAIPAD